MKSERLSSWQEFKIRIAEVKKRMRESYSPVLFRGQNSSSWNLDTTLDRHAAFQSVEDYYGLILSLKPQIESFTGLRWKDDPLFEQLLELTSDSRGYSRAIRSGSPPHHEYMLYLRHHGFPSPLLDWTRSPFIAAYFAFRLPSEDAVSIFAFAKPRLTRNLDQVTVRQFTPLAPMSQLIVGTMINRRSIPFVLFLKMGNGVMCLMARFSNLRTNLQSKPKMCFGSLTCLDRSAEKFLEN